MRNKAQRDVLSRKTFENLLDMCAPPSYLYLKKTSCQNERMSLCTLRGSLTVEASIILPFFLSILLAFFSFFSYYASAAQLQTEAAAEAKKAAIILAAAGGEDEGDVVIHKRKKTDDLWIHSFDKDNYVSESAVCRAWIGFTKLDITETYVYITPEGTVYHLFSDCTHLNLSIQRVSMVTENVALK